MKVTLLNSTPNAEHALIFSKNTRLKMDVEHFENMAWTMTQEEINRELNYVFGTISSCWEFVDYTFMIEDVTRAFTHQLVRHRVGVSFAQQSMRTIDMAEFEYLVPEGLDDQERAEYIIGMEEIRSRYNNMVEEGAAPEDARGILPTNILTNIMMKINLRSLAQMMNSRLCSRAQKEFRDVMEKIKREVTSVHPWSDKLLVSYCDSHKRCYFKNNKGCGKYES